MGNVIVWIVWIVAAFACLGSGIAVVSFSNPFYSALALIGNLGSLAVLFLLLSGEFVAAGQVLVYGGAVMVMFLFVIAYLGDRADIELRRGSIGAAIAIGFDYGGRCPRGGWAEDLTTPPGLLGRYPALKETLSPDPAQRTRWIVFILPRKVTTASWFSKSWDVTPAGSLSTRA